MKQSSTMKSRTTPLEGLRNIGPTIAGKLAAVGIRSREQLARIGAVGAYRLIARHEAPRTVPVCYYLYSLEGALRQVHWDALGDAEKAALRAEVRVLRRRHARAADTTRPARAARQPENRSR